MNASILLSMCAASLVALSATAAAQTRGTRFAPSVWETGSSFALTSKIEIVDLDRDGRSEAAVVRSLFSGDAVLLRGAEDGSLESRTTIGSPFPPITDIASGDFNGDGWPEFVVQRWTTPSLSTELSDGVGGFLPPLTLTESNDPSRPPLVADFDNDGFDDVAWHDDQADRIFVRRGGPQGPTSAAIESLVQAPSGWSWGEAAGDFDGDGNVDIALSLASPTASRVAILRGDGQGRFIERYSIENSGLRFAADFEGDGVVELVTWTLWSGSTIQRFSAGKFLEQPIPTAPGAWLEAAHDLDGDGDLDGIFASSRTPQLRLYENGGFRPAGIELWIPREAAHFEFGDMNGDGLDDIVAVFLEEDPLVLFASVNGRFDTPRPTTNLVDTTNATAGDLNGDGRADVVALRDGAVSAYIGAGEGEFLVVWSRNVSGLILSLQLADLDIDGDLDLFGARYTSNFEYFSALNDGTGNLSDLVQATFSVPSFDNQRQLADVDGDGKLDIIVRSNGISVGRGDGVGGFGAPVVTTPNSFLPWATATADFDCDGRADLVVTGQQGEFEWYRGMPDGSFNVTLPPAFIQEFPLGLQAGDFDGDGNADVVFAFRNPGANSGAAVACMRGRGNFLFHEPVHSPLALIEKDVASLSTARFGAGRGLDLVVRWAGESFDPSDPHAVEVLVSLGDGRFRAAHATWIAGESWADFNGDGRTDLLGRGFGNSEETPRIFFGK